MGYLDELWGAAQDVGSTIGGAAKSAYGAIGPPSTAGIQAAAADSKALEQQFLQQMQQNPYAQVPGVSYAGSAPVVGAQSSAPGAAGAGPSTPGSAPPTAVGMQAAIPGGAGAGPSAPGTSAMGSQGAVPTAPINPNGPGYPAPPPGAYMGPGNAPFGKPGEIISTGTTEARSGPGHFSPTGGTTYQVPGQTGPGGAPPPGAPPGLDANGNPLTGPGSTPPAAPGMVASSMQAAQLDPTQQAQFRAAQMGLVGNLAGVLSGQAPSVAQIQQQQAFGQQMAQQQGLAAAYGRGGNQALALRNAMGNVGQLGAQQAGASALLRAQEQATARGQMNDVLTSGRGQDIGFAGQNAANIQAGNALNAQMQQQANANNQQAQISTRGQNIQNTQNMAGNVLQANQNQATALGAAYNAQAAHNQANASLVSSGIGALAMLSDKRTKEDIETADTGMMREFLSKMKPQTWRYKGQQEQHVGPMAQDVEKSKVGKTIVRETPAGKAIDLPSASTALLAAVADLHRRIAAVEGKRAA